MFRKIGLPSATAAAFAVISMAFTSRPRTDVFGSTSGRTRDGYCIASSLSSSS
jgi:hypothetical protein